MTTIERDRIQFEGLDIPDDGNGQMHRDAAAARWAAAATDYLEAHGGGEARVTLGRDHHKFTVRGLRTIADAADLAGMGAVADYEREVTEELTEDVTD